MLETDVLPKYLKAYSIHYWPNAGEILPTENLTLEKHYILWMEASSHFVSPYLTGRGTEKGKVPFECIPFWTTQKESQPLCALQTEKNQKYL